MRIIFGSSNSRERLCECGRCNIELRWYRANAPTNSDGWSAWIRRDRTNAKANTNGLICVRRHFTDATAHPDGFSEVRWNRTNTEADSYGLTRIRWHHADAPAIPDGAAWIRRNRPHPKANPDGFIPIRWNVADSAADSNGFSAKVLVTR